ncbi:helix-turn-helix domain-containing protein [Agrobacterium deltaense]|uniref:helix-turn-helix domain-containing protein n=1 Tax=Agrobacterium deltaense TaxID=1183412 RepID=UPI003D95A4DB
MSVTGEYSSFARQVFTPVDEVYWLRDIFRHQPPEHLPAGRSLFLEGDEARHVFQVTEGVLRVFRIIADGRRIVTGFLYAGDILGISAAKRYLYSAETVSRTTLRRVTRTYFESAVRENHRLQPELLLLVSDEMAAAQEQMVLLSSKNAEERVCTFLLKFLARTGLPGEQEKTVELPMCRQDIADYLGMTIETVSRTFTKLISKGVVRIENAVTRQTIIVNNPLLLAQLAGDDDDYVDLRKKLVVPGGRHRHQ